MKKFSESIFLCCLWLIEIALLPAFLPGNLTPRLVLAGLIVLAMSEEQRGVWWLAVLLGLWFDLTSGLLVGSYTLAFFFGYEVLRYGYIHYFPSSYRIWLVVIFSWCFGVLLDFWIYIYGFVAARFGWPITVEHFFALEAASWIKMFVTAGCSFLAYFTWQEFNHWLFRPITEKKL